MPAASSTPCSRAAATQARRTPGLAAVEGGARPGPGGVAATLGRLADAAQQIGDGQITGGQAAGGQATAVLALLDPLIRTRYPDATARISDLQRLADAAAAQPSLHDVLAELTLDPPVSSSDLAGPPRWTRTT